MTNRKNNGRPFEAGHAKVGGRVKGSRNKLTADFIRAICADFDEHGEEAIRIVRVERPHEYLRVIAGILPKEFDINDNRLRDIPDEELDAIIKLAASRRIADHFGESISSTDSGEVTPLN